MTVRGLVLASLASVTLAACGGRPALSRATAVAVGAFGTAIASSATHCNDRLSECRVVTVNVMVAATGVALSAASVAYLAEDDEQRARSKP